MGLFEVFDARDLLSYPDGENSTDTVFGNVHFNLTTLQHWNYSYYSNGTLSNNSKCWLTFEPYEPALLYRNGSFVNATKCYSAILDMGPRAYTGIGFAVAYGIALVLTLTALAKHGPLYLPKEKRFYPIGRRWQWYWGCFVSACGLISLLTGVDVDRYYLQELPIVLTTFFWYLLCMGTVLLTWEAVRHWGVWQERQYIDPNPFVYAQDDKRGMIEFWMPLWTYFWVWMNFFMVVPRGWTFAEKQRSPEQTAAIAKPGATSIRFKAGAFMLIIAWATIIFSLRHSIAFYKERNRGILNRTRGFFQAVPFRFMLMIPLVLAMIGYQIAISFVWDLSLIKVDVNVGIMYGWGYVPPLLILYIQVIYAYFSPNEDKELHRQRRERGELLDRELGIVKKPAWWRRVRGEHLPMRLRDKIGMNVKEIGGGHATGRRVEESMERFAREEMEREARNGEDDIEMSPMQGRYGSHNPRVDRAGARHLSTTSSGAVLDIAETGSREQPPPYSDQNKQNSSSGGRSNSVSTTGSLTAPPQQIKSMLDI